MRVVSERASALAMRNARVSANAANNVITPPLPVVLRIHRSGTGEVCGEAGGRRGGRLAGLMGRFWMMHGRAGTLMLATVLCAACGGGPSGPDTSDRSEAAPEPPAATTATGTKDRRPRPTSHETRSGQQRLADIARSLPLTEQAGQLVMTKLSATELTTDEVDALRRGRLGGVIVFDFGYSDPEQLGRLADRVQQVGAGASSARIGMLVAADQEGGDVRAFDDLPPERSAPVLGGTGDEREAYQQAKRAGEALARHGVNMDLAPVADLAAPPRRIMAGRSFGDDPALVGKLADAWVRGMQDGGVAATVKHFPGFGAASDNSDLGVARVERSRAELLAEDVAAFEPALEHSEAVMVSHGIYAGLGAELPASLAEQVIEPLLRERLGYDGVVVTDSLNARGLRDAWGQSVPSACAQAIRVGADIALVTGSMETALLCRREIVRGVRDGSIPRERVREALMRVLTLKARRGLLPPTAG